MPRGLALTLFVSALLHCSALGQERAAANASSRKAPVAATGTTTIAPPLAAKLADLELLARPPQDPGFEAAAASFRLELPESATLAHAETDAAEALWHHFAGRWDDAVALYERGIARLEELETTPANYSRGKLLVRLGTVRMQQGRYDDAITIARRGLDALGDGPPVPRLIGHNTLGASLRMRAKPEFAVAHYFQALELAVAHNEQRYLTPLWLNIGEIKSFQGDLEGALAAFEKARDYNESLGLGDRNSHLWNCIGETLRGLDRREDAVAAFERGLAIAERVADPRSVATHARSLAKLAMAERRLEEALEWSQRALTHDEAAANDPGIAMSSCRFAEACILLESYDDARTALATVAPLIEDINSPELTADFHGVSEQLARALHLTTAADEHAARRSEATATIEAASDSPNFARDLARGELRNERLENRLATERSAMALELADADARAFRIGALGTTALLALLAGGLFLHSRQQRARRLELEGLMKEIKTLRGLLPICAYCKDIRVSDGNWTRIESYVRAHSEANFTHGICPTCVTQQLGEIDG